MSLGKNVSFCVLLGIAAGSATYVHNPELLRKLPKKWHSALRLPREIPGSYIGNTLKANDWADPEALQDKLRDIIDQRLTGTGPEQVKAFLKDPENRLLLAQQTLAQTETSAEPARKAAEESYTKTLKDLQNQLEANKSSVPAGSPMPPKLEARNKRLETRIAAIENELKSSHAIHESVATPSGSALMEHLGNNLDWLQQITSTGEKTNPGATLAILEKIARKNPNMLYDQMERDIATATAVEFARSGWAQEDAVNRALYYTQNWREKRLNSVFNTLPFWQRRIVCGLKGKGTALGAGGNDKAGSTASLEYSLDNVHLPAYRYTGSCWQAPYRLHNIYGESIHGPHYHETFTEIYGDNFNELTRTVGGVCGGLSHYGATTATANGVPAMTSGEPGHCSYVVLVNNQWTPAYSLSWQRGMHWQVFQGNNKFSALHMATQLFSPEEKEKTELSQAMQNLGNTYADSNPEKAQSFYMNATQAQPLNYYAWRDYANFLKKSGNTDPAAWSALCDELQRLVAPQHAEMAAELLKAHVYPGLKQALGNNKEELQRLLLSFWGQVKGMGPDAEWDKGFHARWDVEGMAQAQLSLLGINPQKDPAAQDFFRTLMSTLSNNTEYAPIVLSWGNSLLEKMDKNLQGDFMAAMLGGMGSAGGDDAQRETMLKPVILAAEKTEDIKSFQAIGKSLPQKYRQPETNKLPNIPPMADKLVSQGGVLQTSSTSNFDNPCNHWGILEPGIGGAFHTGKDTDAWVKVVLPKQANVTGITIQTTTGNLWRLNDMVVQVSENGTDWKEVAALGPCKQQTITVDLSATAPLAKYVRIVRKGGPEFFHLRAIYVYGKPAA